MKGVFLILIFIFLLLLAGVCFVSFYIPQKMIFKYNQNPFLASLNIISLEGPGNHEKTTPYLKTISNLRDDFIAEGKNFLEANLSTMAINLYKEGKLVKEMPILKKGNPQEWGGSALGIYSILSGNKLSFSGISQVYMPHALHYYGKYYIHGEPYYPGGEKRETINTGGCIQLNNSDAAEVYELAELNMPILVINGERDTYQFSQENLSDLPSVSAKSYLAADLDSAFILAEKNSQEQLPIASLTKLMLAVVVSENVNLKRTITIKPGALEAHGITEGLEEGKTFRVVELFYPLLIESSNDAAEALSYFLGRTKTIEMMQEKAKSILMYKTQFVDPHGFDLNNISTAQDLFQLAKYVLESRPLLLEITKGKEVRDFGEVVFNIPELWNKNIFITDTSFVGGKTGYLPEAKNSSLFIFKFLTADGQSRNIAIILLGSVDIKTDTQRIYKWLQDNYALSPAPES